LRRGHLSQLVLRTAGLAAVCLLLGTIILVFVGDNAHALPPQVLPNIPGYIPVYIRNGDQPLEDINPALAEAFHEKQTLENIQAERHEHVDKILENRPSYDEVEEDDGGLDAGAQRKGTVYLIGVRQSSGDKSKGVDDGIVPKIALPFEPLERETEDGQDRAKAEDAWIEVAEKSHERKPIALSKEAVIKVGGLPVNVKDLERLAADVEKEETRPNDLYDSTGLSSRGESARRVASTHVEKVAARRPVSKLSNTDDDDLNARPVEDPKESRSSRRLPSEPMLRPAVDPKESRPDHSETDFMEGEE